MAVAVLAIASFAALSGGIGRGGPGVTPTTPAIQASLILPTPSPTPSPTSAASTSAAPGATPAPISGIACDVDERTTYHVHAHLNIRIAGQLRLPPAGVGILPTCLYWLHTHAAAGVIHVEAPGPGSYTLGQFFDVWAQPLTTTQVLDHTLAAGEHIFAFIDGKAVDVDPRSIELTDLRSIEIQVGPTPLEPLPYTFPAEFE